MLAGHDAIRAAISLAGDDRDLGDGGLRERKKQFRAVFDYAAKLLLSTGQKAGNVLKGNEWNIEGIAKADKTRAFERSIDIENAGEKRRLIGDNAHRAPVETRKTLQ